MYTHKQIRVNGVVQGVGFRPFVHKIALINDLLGWVLNDSQGVLIEVQGSVENYAKFKRQLLEDKPPMASIISCVETSFETNHETGAIKYTSFLIKESLEKLNTTTIVPPDANVCPDCIREMFDRTNRRYLYPFINCTNCGPRFSLIEDMPYDRKNTTRHSVDSGGADAGDVRGNEVDAPEKTSPYRLYCGRSGSRHFTSALNEKSVLFPWREEGTFLFRLFIGGQGLIVQIRQGPGLIG